MIDASHYTLLKNIEITKKVVEYAHDKNVTVEAEIGQIGGTEDGMEGKNYNAKLEDVIALVNSTHIDSVAPALGSVHGLYKGKPNLDFITMKKISENVSIPLVLHGGTGIPDNLIQEAIKNGTNNLVIPQKMEKPKKTESNQKQTPLNLFYFYKPKKDQKFKRIPFNANT